MRVAGESLTLSSARREYGLVAGDQSAARLARVIIGHVGGDVHTETVARELVVHSLIKFFILFVQCSDCSVFSLSVFSDQ